MYGETSGGKVFKPGVQVACIVSADEQTTTTDEFGPDLQQTATFSFIDGIFTNILLSYKPIIILFTIYVIHNYTEF